MQDETWQSIPELDRYEISTAARVRSMDDGNYPEGRKRGDDIVYDIDGETYTVDELMRGTYGDDIDYAVGHEPSEQMRELSQYEESEIIASEGLKPAFEVAEEFRIDSMRVREIWDGRG